MKYVKPAVAAERISHIVGSSPLTALLDSQAGAGASAINAGLS